MNIEKYCIIGGGANGIGIGKCFQQSHIPFEIIESEDDFGGNWYYGKAAANVYDSTHLISSKTNTQFSDFPMPDTYPAYPSHELFLRYLRNVAKHFDLHQHTTFNVKVNNLIPEKDYWKVILSNKETRTYKGIIIANGRLNQPLYPNYKGNFFGQTIHSSQYRHTDIFKGKNVLVVGAGNSGCDLAVDAALNARKTYHSTRRGYHYMPKFIDGMPTQEWLMHTSSQFSDNREFWQHVKKTFKLAGFDPTDYGLAKPDHDINEAHPIMNSQLLYHIGHGDIVPKPDIKLLQENHVLFNDDSSATIDLIVYATGFKMSFPFLMDKHFNENQNTLDIFLHTFSKKYSNLFFVGFLNAASGFGNFSNATGRLLSTYIKAYEAKNTSFHIFEELKKGDKPDIGEGNFINSKRHNSEVDLWKYIKAVNFLKQKLEAA